MTEMMVQSYQFLGRRIVLAELTRHGSAKVGEFKILRAYSLDEAMTMKLKYETSMVSLAKARLSHIEHTDGAQVA
jgi:hypothetical protein